MSVLVNCRLPEKLKQELEKSEIPLAVYQLVDGKITAVLVSDGLVLWQAPGRTRKDLLNFLGEDMYKNVHSEDLVYVATKSAEFEKEKNGRYDVVYRQKLYGKDEYRNIHAVGYHRYLEDNSKCTIVVYDDVTAAIASNGESR